MTINLLSEKIQPEQIQRYQDWEKSCVKNLPGRYYAHFQAAPVFLVRDSDRPHANNYNIKELDGNIIVTSTQSNSKNFVTIENSSHIEIEKILQACDGKTPISEIASKIRPQNPKQSIQTIIAMLLGCAIELKDEISLLEKGISRAEIVRFPMQPPYLLLREYWSNCRDVRNAIPTLFEQLHSPESFKAYLAHLHILATMGANLNSFYGGAGAIPTIPGGFRQHYVQTGLPKTRFEFINSYLKENGFDTLAEEDRDLILDSKLALGSITNQGRTVKHSSPDDAMLNEIFDEIRKALLRAQTLLSQGKTTELISTLAHFHKLFLHSHPFYNINNSIAMNIINSLLNKAKLGIIPHLLLDFIALRVELKDYKLVFSKTIENYAFHSENWEQESDVIKRITAVHDALGIH